MFGMSVQVKLVLLMVGLALASLVLGSEPWGPV
jgi:hypothetical protein